jgi:hypothetical protein
VDEAARPQLAGEWAIERDFKSSREYDAFSRSCF